MLQDRRLQNGSEGPAVSPGDGKGRGLGRRQPTTGMRWMPWAGLLLSLAVTVVGVIVFATAAHAADSSRFSNAVDSARDRVVVRLSSYASLLRSAGSFVTVGEGTPSAEDFSRYVEGLDLPSHYPGIRGLGLVVRLSPPGSPEANRTRLEAVGRLRAWPERRGQQSDIVTLFHPPLAVRNIPVIGYDMSSDAVRSEAIERAARTGDLAMSGKIQRQVELDGAGRAGFNLYQPIYTGTRAPSDEALRQERLVGFVYVPFQAQELFDGLFGSETGADVDVEVFDGAYPDANSLLFRSSSEGDAQFTRTQQLEVFGRTWTVRFTSRPAFEATTMTRQVPWMALAGLLGSLLVFHLLSRQARAHQQAAENASTLRLIVDSGVSAIAVADARTGRLVEANDSFLQLAGIPGEQLEGRQLKDFLPAVAAGHDARVEVGDGRVGRKETQLIRDDGSSVPVLLGRALLPGAQAREVVVAVDLSERKKFETALRRSEERYKLSSQATRDLIWDLDLTTKRVVWSGGGATDFGQPEGVERPSIEILDRIHPDDVDRVRHFLVDGVFEEGTERVEGSFRFLLATGEWAWVEARGFVVRESDGRAVRMVGSVADVSDRYRVEEERARLLREAQEGVRIRDEFLSVASHELKTPLTPLSLRLQKLGMLADQEDDRELAQSIRHHVDEGRRQVVKITELIATLLDVGRIDSGTMRTLPDEVELAGLVREAVEHREEEARRAGSALEVAVDGPIRGTWDPRRIEQIVDNLVANAIKYGQGNPIEISLTRGEPGWVVLRVHDSGIGIDRGSQTRIFDRFARAVSERHYGGLGLGLYVTRALVEAQGGTIRVESVPGEGSTFTVDLPYDAPDACGIGRPASPPAP